MRTKFIKNIGNVTLTEKLHCDHIGIKAKLLYLSFQKFSKSGLFSIFSTKKFSPLQIYKEAKNIFFWSNSVNNRITKIAKTIFNKL